MVAGAASLVLQLVLTGRVLRVFGVGVALFIVPVAMASASLGVIVFGTLVAASALKASDQVLRYSIDKATVELLYLPLSAAETFRVKSFIDTVVYRLGDGLGGLAVLACAAWLGWNPMRVGWVTLAAVGAWMAAAAAARTRYVTNLQESIRQHRVEAERAYAPILDRSATQALAAQLRGSPDEILYALSLFESANVVHPGRAGTARSRVAGGAPARDRAAVERQRGIGAPRGREAAARPEPRGADRSAALHDAAHQRRPADADRAARRLPGLLDPRRRWSRSWPGPAAPRTSRRRSCCCSGWWLRGGRRAAQPARGGAGDWHSCPTCSTASCASCSRTMPRTSRARRSVRPGCSASGQFAHRIIDRLQEPALTETVVEALGRMGDRVVGTIRDRLVDPDTPAATRHELPAALQAIGSPAAQAVLMESLLAGDTVLRMRVVTALNKLVQLHPDRRLDRQIVETALAAEITGHYRSYQMLTTMGAGDHQRRADRAGAA